MELFFVKHHSKPNYYKHAHTLCLIITIFLLRSPLLVGAQYFHVNHHHNNSDRNSNPLYLGMAFAAATTFIIVVFITVNIYCKSSPASRVRADDGLGRRASVGLDPSVVETFPVFKYSEVAAHRVDTGMLECAVCLSPFEADDDEKLRLLPKCNHVFHVSCVDPWLKDHSTCPLCRADLAPESDVLTQPDSGQGIESGGTSREAVEVNDDNVFEVRGDIEEGQVGKIYKRWKSTGHVAQLERVNEDNWKRFTLKLPEERMKKLGEKSSKFKRTRSSF